MAKTDRETLKGYFKTGATPTQGEFESLLESVLIQGDDLMERPDGGPLGIYASGEPSKPVIRFYEGFEENPLFTFDLAPSDTDGEHHGLNIADLAGKSRLFLQRDEPRMGIGTLDPQATLDVAGSLRVRSILQEDWQPITLKNKWVAYSMGWNDAEYFKDALGFVHLRGMITGGTRADGTEIFELPEGYRPVNKELLMTIVQNGSGGYGKVGRIDADPNGQVVIRIAGDGWLCLDGLTFRAAD